MIQGSPEWHKARLGRATASRIPDIIALTYKGAVAASRANYMAELLAERLTGQPTRGYVSPEMQWGTDHEADARAAYSFYADVDVTEVGFIPHPTIVMAGASPDGLVADDGQTEIKCPNTATHLDTLLGGNISGRHVTQMQWQMACTQRKWCDYVSYDPRLPESMRLHVRRVERDDVLIAGLEQDVALFLEELAEKEAALRKLYVDRAPGPPTIEDQAATLLADVNERGIPRCLARGKDTPLIMGG